KVSNGALRSLARSAPSQRRVTASLGNTIPMKKPPASTIGENILVHIMPAQGFITGGSGDLLNCDARLETPWRARVGILLHQILKHRTTEVGLFAGALTSSNGSGYHNIEPPSLLCHRLWNPIRPSPAKRETALRARPSPAASSISLIC